MEVHTNGWTFNIDVTNYLTTDITVTLTNTVVEVSGTANLEDHFGSESMSFYRKIVLPEWADSDKIIAVRHAEWLKIDIPRKTSRETNEIRILTL